MKNFGISIKFQYDIDGFLEKIDEFAEDDNYGYSLEEIDGSIVLNFEILFLFVFLNPTSLQMKLLTTQIFFGSF